MKVIHEPSGRAREYGALGGMMGWSIGCDAHWKRDVGYDVPAICDYPGCEVGIDHGLSYVCA